MRRQLVMLAGFLLVIAGVWLVFPPAGLVIGGLLLVLEAIEVPE